MHVIMVFIFIIIICLFYYIIFNVFLIDNSFNENMIDIYNESNTETINDTKYKTNIFNMEDEIFIPQNPNINYDFITSNNKSIIHSKSSIDENNIDKINNKNIKNINNESQQNFHSNIINENNYDDIYDDENYIDYNKYNNNILNSSNENIEIENTDNDNDNLYDDENYMEYNEYDDENYTEYNEYDDENYTEYNEYDDENYIENNQYDDILKSSNEDIEIKNTKNDTNMKNIKNDIYSENDLNIPYSDKKYYYNNIGTIMSGQDFIGTNIKIGDNEDIVQHSTPIDSHLLNDGMDGTFLLHNNLCSKSCCSEQYPVPFKLQYDKYVCQNKNEFVPSNYICNNSMQDSGCLCLTKKQGNFLYNRGGNA